MEDTRYYYDLFISYRHLDKDRDWAKKVFEAIERFNLPKVSSVKNNNRLGRVFRDEAELPTSPNLSDDIERALSASRFLIVICSKDTPDSLWISREISKFIELGRGDKIFALLIDGEADVSLPIPFKKYINRQKRDVFSDNNIIDAQKSSIKSCKELLLPVIAGILGISFENLKKEIRSNLKTRNIKMLALIVLFFLAATLISYFWWDYVRIKTFYYNTFVYRRGIPKGLFQYDKNKLPDNKIIYRFDYSKNKLLSVKTLDGSGKYLEDNYGISERTFAYLVSGGIKQMVLRDLNGNILAVKEFTENGTIIDIKDENGMAAHKGWESPSANISSFKEDEKIPVRIKLKYNEDGYVIEEFYFQDQWNTFANDECGNAGKRFVLNNNYQVIEWRGLDENGEVIVKPDKATGEIINYDEMGDITERRAINGKGIEIMLKEKVNAK